MESVLNNQEPSESEILSCYDNAWQSFLDSVRQTLSIKIIGVGGSFADGHPRIGLYPKDMTYIDAMHAQVFSRLVKQGDIDEDHRHPSDIDVQVQLDDASKEEQADSLNAAQKSAFEEHRVFIQWTENYLNPTINPESFKPSHILKK